jgi:hypothetical protein
LLFDEFLRFRAGLAEVHFLFLAVDHLGQMDGRRAGTALALHTGHL